ncbi:DNA cytosine methyltransferase [Methylomonas sp. 2BW1-5-20]|uniref:DNA cytosine methyltransferase n=1 Tax=Methylomonas sp. 2BW1-5-20 TaxID=3376686 RepID=UPI0040530BD2
MLVLSLFPGIGLLDRGFEDAGFCVVRGPDLIFGGDIRRFHAPAGRFDGVIGGPPCQDFSKARRSQQTGEGADMLRQFVRVVTEAKPQWWLAENVPGVPDIRIDGYSWQRLDLNASEFGHDQRRLRHVQFGALDGSALRLDRKKSPASNATVLANDNRPLAEIAGLQGLPSDFDIPAFTRGALTRAIGNGVPYGMAYALAQAVLNRTTGVTLCACSCGRPVTGRRIYYDGACRKRAFDRQFKKQLAPKVWS